MVTPLSAHGPRLASPARPQGLTPERRAPADAPLLHRDAEAADHPAKIVALLGEESLHVLARTRFHALGCIELADLGIIERKRGFLAQERKDRSWRPLGREQHVPADEVEIRHAGLL